MLTALMLNITSFKVDRKKFLTKTKDDGKNISKDVYIYIQTKSTFTGMRNWGNVS